MTTTKPNPNTILTVTDTTFEELVAASPVPVLVDFWAPWCPPCRVIAPELEQLAAELGDEARIAKVNVDDNPGLVERFGVASIPTLIVLRAGQESDRVVGAAPRADLAARLRAA